MFADYATKPWLLRERYSELRQRVPIVIDEVQKCPDVLDEVHWLIENRGRTFVLTGSSARRLRRSSVNLRGGRARRREMRPLCFPEVDDLDLSRALRHGMLPNHYLSEEPDEELRGYVADYLREEIAAEALARNLGAFSEFLRVAGLTSGEILNYTYVAREAGISSRVARSYFDILDDTLLGFRVRPWTKSKNRRLIETEKFYLFDIGVGNFLAKRSPTPRTPEYGKSFEHYILMELSAYRSYRAPELEIRFWRTSGHKEVDFVINDKEVAIEVKSSARVHEGDTASLASLCEDGPVGTRIVVSDESQPRRVKDRFGPILILPWRRFLEELWAGKIV